MGEFPFYSVTKGLKRVLRGHGDARDSRELQVNWFGGVLLQI